MEQAELDLCLEQIVLGQARYSSHQQNLDEPALLYPRP